MTASTDQLVEHFFRHESANLIAVLTRAFGLRRIDLIEDMVQAALLEAMNTWKQNGIPDSPAAWLHRVARNRVLDALRREKTFEKALAHSGQSTEAQESVIDRWLEQEQLPDSLLRMIFVCCHPLLERKTQIALTLKTLCGFGVSEIAQGLLLNEDTVRKRIQRAKATLAESQISLELPPPDQLTERLNVVHDVLYLMFNEGYSTSHGVDPIRDDICEEAARLCHLLCQTKYAASDTKALLALMLFQSARLESRTDDEGAVVLLEDQDRSVWDVRLIAAGRFWLTASKTDRPAAFHYEAAIAMQHCLAPDPESTDWNRIVQLYDRLLQYRDTPVCRLNRAIAAAEDGEHQLALRQLEELQGTPELRNYLLLDCAMARIHQLLGNNSAAVDACRTALSKAPAPHQQRLLEKKIRQLNNQHTNDDSGDIR